MSNVINLVKLNYTNLNAVKKTMLLSIGIFVIVSMANSMFLTMIIGLVVMNTTYQTISYEDLYGIDNLIAYLPIKRKEYVLSRYVSAVINVIIAMVIFSICYYMASNYFLSNETLLGYEVTLSLGTASGILGICAIIPCILKLGIVKGRLVATVLMILSMFAPTLIIEAAVESNFAMDIIMKLNSLGLPVVCAIISLAAILISYLISLKLYESKEIL